MLVAPLSTSVLYLVTHSTLDYTVQDLLAPEEEIFLTLVLLNLKLKSFYLFGAPLCHSKNTKKRVSLLARVIGLYYKHN